VTVCSESDKERTDYVKDSHCNL